MKKGLLLLTMLLLTGCIFGRSQQVEFHILTAQTPTVGIRQVTGPKVSVGPLTIPAYLDRPQLFIQNDSAVKVEDFQQWSEPMLDGISRVVCSSMTQGLYDKNGVAFPIQSNLEAPLRLSLDFNRLSGSPGGEVVLDVVYHLTSDQRDTIEFGQIVKTTTAENSINGLAAAYSQLLVELAQELVKIIPAS